MFRGPKRVGGDLGVLWGQEGCLGDPMGPLGWFDECSNDSCTQMIQIFCRTGRSAGPGGSTRGIHGPKKTIDIASPQKFDHRSSLTHCV